MEPSRGTVLLNTLESVLFWRGTPMTVGELAKTVSAQETDVEEALQRLSSVLQTRGVRLVRNGNEVTLGTAPDASQLLESIAAEELSHDLTRAALETLTVILYAGPITRREIDYIRGVNSSFILRNLMVRGLIQRSDARELTRGYEYSPTIEFIRHLGLEGRSDLPEYDVFTAELKQIRNTAAGEDVQSDRDTSEQNIEEKHNVDLGL